MVDVLAAPTADIGGAVGDMWRSVLLFLPKAVAFIAILVVGWLVARALSTLVDRVLERVGFDRAVERGGIKGALARSKYDASDIVAKLVYYGILLFTLQLAFGIWGPNAVSDLIRGVVAWLPKAFVAILIVVIAAAIANAVKDLISNALSGLSYGRLLANLAWVFIIGLGVIAALNQIGVATTVTTPVLIAVLATVAGILIVGVGGGLVRPMQQRWENWLDRAADESSRIAEHAKAYSAEQRHSSAAVAPGQHAYPTHEPAVYQSDQASAHPTEPIPAYQDQQTQAFPPQQAPARSTEQPPVYTQGQAPAQPHSSPIETTQVIPPAGSADEADTRQTR
jgi:hypothetical protein